MVQPIRSQNQYSTPRTSSEDELKVSASKDDKLSADVNVFKQLDVASAISILGTGAIANPGMVVAGSIADTFAGVNRENAAVPGMTDGSDRVGAIGLHK